MKKIGAALIFLGLLLFALDYLVYDLLILGYRIPLMIVLVGIILMVIKWVRPIWNDDTEQETCPRCLGKGNVDATDIKRLRRELEWAPGKCAYCNGLGVVPLQMIDRIRVNEAYLTMDLDGLSRARFLNGNRRELKKAAQKREELNQFKKWVINMHRNQNLDSWEITRRLAKKSKLSVTEFNDLERRISKIIDSESRSRR